MVNAQTQTMTQRSPAAAPGHSDPSDRGRRSPAWILVLVALFSTLQNGFADEQQVTADQLKADVPGQVFRILQENCLKCHSGTAPKGGLSLTSRESIVRGGDSGSAFDQSNPQASLLLKAILYDGLEMPPAGQLSVEQTAVLTEWIRDGLKWPEGMTLKPVHPTREPPQVNDETRRHWSFQPVRKPIPTASPGNPYKNEIDVLIQSKLQAAGLTPNPQAAPEELVRRASYVLLGLPPDPELVALYAADPSPATWSLVVEQLLASPHYGEHWARHWLDLVRYAETNSYERDGAKPFVWRYRDYVIKAFNSDLPYDRFLTEQLAGDELPDRTPESIIATGYYRLGRWDDEPADPELALFDDLDDIIATTGQTMLGLSINCARCHDHKIDPLPQTDYYRLLAFFRGIRRYGVRSEDSVRDASVTELDVPEDQQTYAVAVETYQRDLREIARQLQKTEDRVRASFSGVEIDDFQYEVNRVAIVQKRKGTLLTPQEADQYKRLTERLQKLKNNPPGTKAQALCVKEDLRNLQPTWVLLRGNPQSRGEEVQPGFPEVLSPPQPQLHPSENPETSGRRLALARWITDPANPLTARVMVNRIWQYHFGRGIVRSSSDFGLQGTPPTHPELLDWLAAEFVERSWSLKAMHRLIMNSSTWQMSSRGNEKSLAVDPGNDLFWRVDMRRLTAEEIRDSILHVNGSLNLGTMYGPSVFTQIPDEVKAGQSRPGAGWGTSTPEDRRRRSLYIHVKRSLRDPLLESFDAADTDQTCPVRFSTTQPTQALGLLNSDFSLEQAHVFAQRLTTESPQSEDDRVRLALKLVLQRDPTAEEVQRGVNLISQFQKQDGLGPDEALSTFCLMTLNLNEFLYID